MRHQHGEFTELCAECRLAMAKAFQWCEKKTCPAFQNLNTIRLIENREQVKQKIVADYKARADAHDEILNQLQLKLRHCKIATP
ncbi:hypothetical protein C1H46_027941 [Malus baccata]|uniref:Uncharacterized protein n=1 Tax=Malus baccata TaxID=106549 RepID=A0A540LJI4_MALBA|nr:hypothetical protein C1H46_027941 [Malus baccata]